MKNKLLILISLFCFNISFAQVPQGIPYQAVARNGQGQPLVSINVKVRFSILDSTATGTAVYVESHSTTTSALGLFTANVGMGNASTGTFSSINWGQNFKFLKVELDTTATGNSYIDLGTQQMMSVPYALYAGVSSISNEYSNFNSRVCLSYLKPMNLGLSYDTLKINGNNESWDFSICHNNSCCSGGANRALTLSVSFVDINGNPLPSNSYYIYGNRDQSLQIVSNGSINGQTTWNTGWYTTGKISWNLPKGNFVKMKTLTIQGPGGCCDPNTDWTIKILK